MVRRPPFVPFVLCALAFGAALANAKSAAFTPPSASPLTLGSAWSQEPEVRSLPWSFAVAGDSRNCGDVIMPAIAAAVLKDQARFYWHLGDMRKIYDFDEDILNQRQRAAAPLTIQDYEDLAWGDYIRNQLTFFGSLPLFLGIGNHETIAPKTRTDFLLQFADWLDSPVLQRQRLADNRNDRRLRTYYHWIDGPVDFIYLDNATADQFDDEQMAWLSAVLKRAQANAAIKTLVVGMHEALPESISADHGMNESIVGTISGRRVYRQLLDLQNGAKKNVYVLASHSHYYMEGIFNTAFWRANGGVLPGWIVGTGGAVHYPLPQNWKDAKHAETDVYGYLAGTVQKDGSITFTFHRVAEKDIPESVASGFKPGFVHWCFTENREGF